GELKSMDGVSSVDVKEYLTKFTEVTNRFPNDDEFKEAFKSACLTNKYSREVLFCIALFQLNHDYVDNPKLSLDGFSVEHIMPKKWRNNWHNLPEETKEDYRDYKLLTLGNLTLVKGKLNSSMRDSSWSKKKEALLKFSTLRQTTDYINSEVW